MLKFIVNCVVYDPNIMGEGVVCQCVGFFITWKTNIPHQWVDLLENGRTIIHDEDRSSRSYFISDDFVNKVNYTILENRVSTIVDLPFNNSKVFRSLLHKIMTDKLDYHRFCAH